MLFIQGDYNKAGILSYNFANIGPVHESKKKPNSPNKKILRREKQEVI